MRKLFALLAIVSLIQGDTSSVYARMIGTNPTGSNSDIVCFGGREAGNTVKNANEDCIDSNGNIIPTTVNNQALGVSNSPYSSLWIGTGTNNGTGLAGVQLGTPAGVYIGTSIVSSAATAPILSLAGRIFTSVRAGTAGPSILSNSCGNTATASIAGSDFAGILTLGSGTASACTIAFGDPYLNTPICSIELITSNANGNTDAIVLPTSIQLNTSLGAPGKVDYICIGQGQ